MNNPGTDYARKLVDAQRLERRPGDEMDSSAGAPVFSASSFDVVTPDGKVATRNAAFSINHGRGLSLFGPSGSGKSTIVRAITGERPAERGSVALDLGDGDMHVLARSFKDRSQTELAAVQMVPQDPATSLNPALCVDTQLSRAVRRVHPRWSRKEVRERVSELLALVRLPDEIKRQHPRSLSGGQAQRVAIARALAHEPKVLVWRRIDLRPRPHHSKGHPRYVEPAETRRGLGACRCHPCGKSGALHLRGGNRRAFRGLVWRSRRWIVCCCAAFRLEQWRLGKHRP